MPIIMLCAKVTGFNVTARRGTLKQSYKKVGIASLRSQ